MNQKSRQKRKMRIRKRLRGTTERPRLCVFRSAKHIYAQVIDDTSGKTLAAATSGKVGTGTKLEGAKAVGSAVAQACEGAGIKRVVFDRNGFLYHGRVRAVAEAAREAGLEF